MLCYYWCSITISILSICANLISWDDTYYSNLGTIIVFENINAWLLENKGKVCDSYIIVYKTILQLLKWTVVKISVCIKNGIFFVHWEVSSFWMNLEKDTGSLLYADYWVVKSLCCINLKSTAMMMTILWLLVAFW